MRYLPLVILFTFAISSLACQQKSAVSEEDSSQDYSDAAIAPDWYNSKEMDTLSVVTWNVEHFVDSHNNPYIDNDTENSPPSDMEERRRLLAKAIQQLDADILVFQEFESDSVSAEAG
ncbi:MAG: endonuclease/exonuclease/phosphatase family protein [Fodinibius sp.]|nr:endonuclease/exonuclease/phosphatase family protein [Fodinibius sp.]